MRKVLRLPNLSSPHVPVRIWWEVDGASGSTECPAWRGQYEIDQLERAGYQIVAISFGDKR